MQGMAGTIDDLHQGELDSLRNRMTREKENTITTLKNLFSK